MGVLSDPVRTGNEARVKAILQDNGDLLMPVGACVTAQIVHPGDPRYESLLSAAVPAASLRGTPEEDAALAARFEHHFQDEQHRPARPTSS